MFWKAGYEGKKKETVESVSIYMEKKLISQRKIPMYKNFIEFGIFKHLEAGQHAQGTAQGSTGAKLV